MRDHVDLGVCVGAVLDVGRRNHLVLDKVLFDGELRKMAQK